jgi:hypothetical protein
LGGVAGAEATGVEAAGTVMAFPQALHLACLPANVSATAKPLPQPGHWNLMGTDVTSE